QELKEKLYSVYRSKAEINDFSEKLLTKYLEQEKEFLQLQKALSASKAKILSLEACFLTILPKLASTCVKE
ncbi:44207_t:CDS:1, partial [Gigaspora margarita]